MKCPLRIFVVRCGEETGLGYMPDCLKEECAWWVKASESCAMEAIPRIIGYVGGTIKELKDKMPHEE